MTSTMKDDVIAAMRRTKDISTFLTQIASQADSFIECDEELVGKIATVHRTLTEIAFNLKVTIEEHKEFMKGAMK